MAFNSHPIESLSDKLKNIDNNLSQTVHEVEKDLAHGLLYSAKLKIFSAMLKFQNVPEFEILAFRAALAEGCHSSAMNWLKQIRGKYSNTTSYCRFIVNLAHFGLHRCQACYWKFLDAADPILRKVVLLDAAEFLWREKQLLESMRVYGLLFMYSPESILQYGVPIFKSIIEKELSDQELPVFTSYRGFLAEYISPLVFKYNLHITRSLVPMVFDQKNKPGCIRLEYADLVKYIEITQSYYLAKKEWSRMYEFFVQAMCSSGYLNMDCKIVNFKDSLGSGLLYPDRLLHYVDSHDRFPGELRSILYCCCFVQIAYEYFLATFGPRDSQKVLSEFGRTLMIPVNCDGRNVERKGKNLEVTFESIIKDLPMTDPCLKSFTILKSAGNILELLQRMSPNFEQEMNSFFVRWKVPHYLVNAAILCRADWELYQKSYPKANTLYKTFIDQFQREEPEPGVETQPRLRHNPLIPFRILYCRGLIYGILEDFHQARLNLLPILCSLPFTSTSDLSMNDKHHSIVPFRIAGATELIASAFNQVLDAYELDVRRNGPNDILLGNFATLFQYTIQKKPYRTTLFREMLGRLENFHYPELFNHLFDEYIIHSLYEYCVRNNRSSFSGSFDLPWTIEKFKAKFTHTTHASSTSEDLKALFIHTARRAYTRELCMSS
ncbi:hypothetical protein K7432_003930 [Basidiobolus ranarum]|uniref:Uncharacterized protein n=1 Tax=Basidiobolus ranarum TaxID=34480 RepID=A0ABR2W5N8_9FUNG